MINAKTKLEDGIKPVGHLDLITELKEISDCFNKIGMPVGYRSSLSSLTDRPNYLNPYSFVEIKIDGIPGFRKVVANIFSQAFKKAKVKYDVILNNSCRESSIKQVKELIERVMSGMKREVGTFYLIGEMSPYLDSISHINPDYRPPFDSGVF
jgi:hypothetical protein